MASLNIKSSVALKEKEAFHKGGDLDCEVLSIMMRHLNILKYFSFGIESLWT